MSLYVTYEFMNLEALFWQYLVYKSIVSSTSRERIFSQRKKRFAGVIIASAPFKPPYCITVLNHLDTNGTCHNSQTHMCNTSQRLLSAKAAPYNKYGWLQFRDCKHSIKYIQIKYSFSIM